MSFGSDHLARLKLLYSYDPNDLWVLEGGFNNHQADSAGTDPSGAGLVTTEAPKRGANISANKSLPPVLVGMDKAEALAFVSRMFDTAAAGAVLWGEELLIKRFLSQCSRRNARDVVCAAHKDWLMNIFRLEKRSHLAGNKGI